MNIRHILYFVFLFCAISCKRPDATVISYCNPIPINLGDPYILMASDGKYYLYGTSGENGFRAYSSDNLSDWKEEGIVYQGRSSTS